MKSLSNESNPNFLVAVLSLPSCKASIVLPIPAWTTSLLANPAWVLTMAANSNEAGLGINPGNCNLQCTSS